MKNEKKKMIFNIAIAILVIIIGFILILQAIGHNKTIATYAEEMEKEPLNIDYGTINQFEVLKTIQDNKSVKKEEITEEEEDLEYTTIYKQNKNLPQGVIQVLQEGRDGKQQIITKKVYEGENIVDENIKTNIIIASVDKIVEIGTAGYTSQYKLKIGDTVYATSSTLAIRVSKEKTAQKIITINKNESLKIIDIQDNWLEVRYKTYQGFVESDCVTHIDPNKELASYSEEKTKEELLKTLNKNMSLNKPSGLSLNQFKKVLSGNSQDKYKIFEQNAEYFYYIEKQYNINGIFVASIGIHESNWGTSKIAQDKLNLFGYGASDSNPYGNAKRFSNYAEGIDLIARVLVKYYLNPPGTNIYDGQTASGKYYNGATLSGVNTKYASDKAWNTGVYKWMSYLYNRLEK